MSTIAAPGHADTSLSATLVTSHIAPVPQCSHWFPIAGTVACTFFTRKFAPHDVFLFAVKALRPARMASPKLTAGAEHAAAMQAPAMPPPLALHSVQHSFALAQDGPLSVVAVHVHGACTTDPRPRDSGAG